VWIGQAAHLLLETNASAALLSSPGAQAEAEAFYVCSGAHGHHWIKDQPLVESLRSRAIRILLARALPLVIPSDEEDAATEYPLALIEGMMRGYGLDCFT